MKLKVFTLILFSILLTLAVLFAYVYFTSKKIAYFSYNGYTLQYNPSLVEITIANEPKESSLGEQKYRSGLLSIYNLKEDYDIVINFYDRELKPNNAYGGIVAIDEETINSKGVFRKKYKLNFLQDIESELICIDESLIEEIHCKLYSKEIVTEFPEIYSFYSDRTDLYYPLQHSFLGMSNSYIDLRFEYTDEMPSITEINISWAMNFLEKIDLKKKEYN